MFLLATHLRYDSTSAVWTLQSLRKILNAENVLPGEAMAMMIDLMVNKDCRLYFVGQLYKHTEEFKGRITHLPREIFDQFLKIVKMILEVADDQVWS